MKKPTCECGHAINMHLLNGECNWGPDCDCRKFVAVLTEMRQHALVRYTKEAKERFAEDGYNLDMLDSRFIFFGDIPNQPGHCVLLEVGPRQGFRLFHHTWDFEEVPADET